MLATHCCCMCTLFLEYIYMVPRQHCHAYYVWPDLIFFKAVSTYVLSPGLAMRHSINQSALIFSQFPGQAMARTCTYPTGLGGKYQVT